MAVKKAAGKKGAGKAAAKKGGAKKGVAKKAGAAKRGAKKTSAKKSAAKKKGNKRDVGWDVGSEVDNSGGEFIIAGHTRILRARTVHRFRPADRLVKSSPFGSRLGEDRIEEAVLAVVGGRMGRR